MGVNLSLVVATYNEEENIKDCLESAKDFVDEIVIIDGSSQDKTARIAKSYTSKVFMVPNQMMFHKNKQLGLDKASGDWILQLDADERLTLELKNEIKERIKKDKEEIDGYFIPRKNYFLAKFLKKGGQYPDYVIRLVKKNKAFFPCKSVHEQIEVSGKIGYLTNNLIHLANPTFSKYLRNANRYTTLTAQKLDEQKTSLGFFSWLNYLFWLPIKTFFNLFFRHKGFIDGFYGFIFAVFSGLHFSIAFIKYWEAKKLKKSFDLNGDWE